jgi:hypothetical protein
VPLPVHTAAPVQLRAHKISLTCRVDTMVTPVCVVHRVAFDPLSPVDGTCTRRHNGSSVWHWSRIAPVVREEQLLEYPGGDHARRHQRQHRRGAPGQLQQPVGQRDGHLVYLCRVLADVQLSRTGAALVERLLKSASSYTPRHIAQRALCQADGALQRRCGTPSRCRSVWLVPKRESVL